MKHTKFYILIILTAIATFSFAQDKTSETLIRNIEDYYLLKKSGSTELKAIQEKLRRDTAASDMVTIEVYQRKKADQALVDKYVNSISEDGSWNDINYKDTRRSGWDPAKHAERILFLTRVYKDPDSKFYNNSSLKIVLHKAMDFWFRAKLICPNWWYNEIGGPKTLGPAFIMLKDELSPSETTGAIDVLNKAGFRMTGQNKVWLAGNVFFRAILTGDMKLAMQARDTIASEIRVGEQEGIQPDFSFHQHGPQQQFGNYGLAYITGMAFWGRIFEGTPLAFDESQKAILRDLFYNGYNWVNWKGHFDVNSLGRQFFKDAQVNKSLATGYAAADMIVVDPEQKQIYLDFISRNFSVPAKPLFVGDKHFWRSDMTVHHSPQWFSSIKMSSERVKGAEALNSENLKGYYVADGATYIMVDGNEYNDIFPIWNWRKLPGVTCYQSDEPLKVLTIEGYRNNNDFTGGLSSGLHGITAFHLVRDSLEAKKAWFFINNAMVCLGADITSDKNELVSTTLNQTFLKGDVYYFDKSQKNMSPESQFRSNTIKWIYHDSVGYFPLQKTQLTLSDKTQEGDWSDIAKVYVPEKHAAPIFSLEAEQGTRPQHQSYSYVILPAVSLNDVAHYKPSFTVIKNTTTAQVISSNDKKINMFVVYNPVQVTIDGLGIIRFAQPGLFMLEKTQGRWVMTTADPTHKLKAISFTLNGKKHTIELPANGNSGKCVTKQLE